ncbi:deoxyuridine 5'-triphosphate nucleotidohydrolase [Candidatus Micrarchaeota archaeon]|nr:deoxyuridine 5'-triphosphate nucleotidohydrolase [Candidatus Micrarchaeota archaeon]
MIVVPNINVPELQKQPAGVDLTIAQLFSFTSFGKVDYDNSERKISDVEEVEFDNSGEVFLKPGAYKVILKEIVKIPNDCIGIGLPRSTLLRCGATIETAFWDPGYEGKSEVLLIVYNPHGIKLKRNARILQLTFSKVDNPRSQYNGRYHKENL